MAIMDIKEFKEKIITLAEEVNIKITEEKTETFYKYMNLLIEWNEKINLTAIIEPNEIIVKHFIDSLTLEKHIKNNDSIIDIGTGAGFPGIPLKIQNSSLKVTLLDSTNKKIKFLDEAIVLLQLNNMKTIHGRAEELGRSEEHREKYDVCTSRAVAKLNVLAEYMLPLVKVGGQCLCMKGPNVEEELREAEKTIKLLGGEITQIDTVFLPKKLGERTVITINKASSTQNGFPKITSKINKEKIK